LSIIGLAGLASHRRRPFSSNVRLRRSPSLDIESLVPLPASASRSSLPHPRGGRYPVALRRTVAGRPQCSQLHKGASRLRPARASVFLSATGHRRALLTYRCVCAPLQTQCNNNAFGALQGTAAKALVSACGARYSQQQHIGANPHAPAPGPQPNPSLNRSANGRSPWPRGASRSSCTSRPRRPAAVARLAPR
jgi:hypothetical protein